MATDKDTFTTLSEVGEEVMDSLAYSAKRGRESMLKHFVEDALDEALSSLPEAERQEIAKRLRKLFVANFKTPEMDKLMRDKVSARARELAETVLETWDHRIEQAVQEELELTWRDVVSMAVRTILSATVLKVSSVFAKKLDALAEEIAEGKNP